MKVDFQQKFLTKVTLVFVFFLTCLTESHSFGCGFKDLFPYTSYTSTLSKTLKNDDAKSGIHMGIGSFLGGSWSSNRCPCIANKLLSYKPLSIYYLFPATWQEAASMVFMFSKIANFVLFARSDLRLGLLYLILCLGEYLHQ